MSQQTAGGARSTVRQIPPITARGAVVAWVLTRLVVFGVWQVARLTTQGDVLYYWRKLNPLWLGLATPQQTLTEYPTPVIWILSIPYWLAGRSRPGYVVAFIALMLLLDALFAVALWRAGGRFRGQAVMFWIAFTFVMGPTAYMRFDLLTAVLVGMAVLGLLRNRPGRSGAWVGLGAAIKLWPAELYPALLGGDRRTRLWASATFWGVGGGLALASLLYAGWTRLLSPLTWQSERGLQVESIWATFPMVWRLFEPGSFHVAISKYQAFEISGPTTATMLSLASIATAIGLLVIALVYVRWLWRGQHTVVASGLIMLLVISITIITNKTFSPQYIMWLGGPMAALLVAVGHGKKKQQSAMVTILARVAIAVLVITVLTQLVYPVLYSPLVNGGFWVGIATVVLVVRNVAMVAFTVWIAMLVWKVLHRAPDGRAERRRGRRK